MRRVLRRMIEARDRVYGLDETDLDYTVRLTRRFVEATKTLYRQQEERTRAKQPELADDILDDVAYYRHIDNQYLWHFCLWRLQGTLEGMIVSVFIPKVRGRLIGLKSRLDAMKKAGYVIEKRDYVALLRWGDLRNRLSHEPPEQYTPGALEERDILEYRKLLRRVIRAWLLQREQAVGKTPDLVNLRQTPETKYHS